MHLAFGQTVKILFDASKAEAAGNADWVVDADSRNLGYSSGPANLGNGNESNAQRIPTAAQSGVTSTTAETFWSGALSYWGIDCAKRNYIVESLPYNGSITYGNSSNPQDLSNYNVFIVCEPNIVFTAAQKTAIMNFVQNGGGLLMVADHDVSDRNNDGIDSPHIWNDLMTNNSVQANPFGMSFDYANFSQTTSNIPTLPGDSILGGPMGNVTQLIFTNGTSITLNPAANASVKGVVYKTGSSFGNTNVMCAYARFGNGKVAAIGDSSPCDDGSGDPNDALFTGYAGEAAGNHRKLLMNMTIWLATPNAVSAPVANFSASPVTTCVNQAVTFTNSSTGTITSYLWNFGSGATPATATTAGPHNVTYSTSGSKTISLTVSNGTSNNTLTKSNYVTVDAVCGTADLGMLSLLSPVSLSCPTANSTIQVRIKNYGTSSINFATVPAVVTLAATNPSAVVQNFSDTIDGGSLAAGATKDVTFAGNYSLSQSGTYTFNSTTIFTGDINAGNNSMAPATITIGQGYQSDVSIVAESMGVVAANTPIATHETNNGFINTALTMSGTAEVRNTQQSTGYAGASAGANVFFTNSAGRTFIISGINTSAATELHLSFGMFKNSTLTSAPDFLIQVSTDGINYTNLTLPTLPATASWNYVTVSGNIPATANLRIKFTQTATTNQYRVDDLLLYDHVTAPSISSANPLTFCEGGSATLTSSIAPFYSWSNGATTQSINVTSNGDYFVVATNAAGCTAASSILTVNVNPAYPTTENRFIASGSSYVLPSGASVSTSGTYLSSFLTQAGCDSSVTTILSVVNINDNSLCTSDAIDLFTGAVTHTTVPVDDNNPCTIDGCDPLTGVFHTPAAEICGNGIDDNCNGQIDENCPVSLTLKFFVEGLYKGSGQMAAVINPVSLPTVADSVTIELHAASSPYQTLFTDKKTFSTSGICTVTFPVLNQNYFIVLKHRNSLETWSALPVTFSVNTNYDFTTVASKAFGSALKNVGASVFALVSGDVNRDGQITLADLSLIESASQSFQVGYLPTDINGNGQIESSDASVTENNLNAILQRP
jgi:PKD repeat protein